jgi:uncharacterized protein YbgA (DUF1722 family)/uncharacterized protein YbbK (DUF523 family)
MALPKGTRKMDDAIKLGISSCLLGNKVRYDGGHQHDRYLTDTLGRYVCYVPVCPEVECGLPIPRETLRLVGDADSPRLMTSKSGRDFTDQMKSWAERRLAELANQGLDGFIFKRMSPSSGMERVKLYSPEGMPSNRGVGIFAKAFMDRFPLLPVEEDGRLHDPILRENFIQRIFVHRRWRTLASSNMTRGGLVDFHTTHKLLLLSHSEKEYREMGRLVAHAKEMSLEQLFSRYEEMLMTALKKRSTINKHVNVLTHILGHFKLLLGSEEKQQALEILDNYHQGLVPLIVPVTLLNYFVKKYKSDYLSKQHYLDPHPLQLKLLNHA